MKKNLFSIIILFTLVFFKTFSQEVNKIGVHLELEYSTEITKKGDNVGGFSFFVTPSYKIGENATVGIGTGAKLFKSLELINDVGSIEYRDKKLVSIPLYVNTMYKFKVNKTTPFVECKLGYSFLNRDYSWKSSRLFPEHQGVVDVQSNLKGGFLFSPSIGVLLPINNRQYFSVSLAYCLERFSGKANFIQVNKVVKSSSSHHLAALRVGYIF
ncbi:MAG TPA: hypothetical protein PLW70_06760 [Bacteroidales bacterium]|nr:hypothetical protein [Bacteroidales bacterium]